MAFTWTQELTISELQGLIREIPGLRQSRRFSAEHTRWTMPALTVLEQVFGQNSRYYLSFAALKWNEQGSFIIGGLGDPEGAWNPQAAVERVHHKAYLNQLDAAHGFLQAA